MPVFSGDAPDPGVVVVIPNHNGEAWLKGCLEGLAGQELGDFGVVLVDNGSSDRSVELVRELRPDAKLILLGENRGFAVAVNLGIAATKAEYVALLNTDTVARPSWLSALVRALKDAPPEVAAAAPRMLRMDEPSMVDDAGDALYWTGAAEKVGHGRPASEYAHPREIFSPSAGASLYRRSFLEDMGGFDERFFAYLEDVDLGLRGRLCGYRFIFEPAAEILHKGHGSGVVGGPYVQLVTRNRLLLFTKNLPWSLLLKNLARLLCGQVYFFLAYRRPFRSLAGYASFVRLVPHVLRERRRMKLRIRLESEEIDRLLAPRPDHRLCRMPRVWRLNRWVR
jgi:GT2 family glycosyltransferase